MRTIAILLLTYNNIAMSIGRFRKIANNHQKIPIDSTYTTLLNDMASIIQHTPKTYEISKIDKIIRKPLGVPDRIYTILKANEKLAEKIIPKDNVEYVLNILKVNDSKRFAVWYNENSKMIKPIDVNNPDILCDITYETPFISVDIQNIIEATNFAHYSVIHDNINLNLFVPTNHYLVSPSTNDAIDTINKTIRICKFMSTLSKFEGEINLRFIYLDVKKCIPADNVYFLPQHINSASTLKRRFITMWRKEEWEKILIHELIHYMGLDFTYYIDEYTKMDRYLYETFNMDGEVVPFEIYTELLAILIYTIYILVNARNNFSLNEFEKLYNIQISFAIFQTAKIIKYYNGHKYEDIFTLGIKQKTSVLSYYIVRAAIMYNVNMALEFFRNNISFGNRTDNFITLIDKSIKNKKFQESVDNIIIMMNNINDQPLMKTMRMQIF
jgi:hypothetical protein